MTVNGQSEGNATILNEEHQHDATAKRTLLVDTKGDPYVASGGGGISSTVSATILGGTVTASQGTSPWSVRQESTFVSSLSATEEAINISIKEGTITGTLNASVYQGTSPWVNEFTNSLSSSISSTQSALNVSVLAGDIEVSTLSATILGGTLSVDNFPSGFTNTITGTVGSTILGGTVTASQGTSPWITEPTSSFVASITATEEAMNINAYQADDPWSVLGTMSVTGSVSSTITNTLNATVYQGTSPWIINGTMTGTVLATVTGTVSVDNFPSTQAVSGTVSNTVLGGTLDNITSTLKATVYQGTDPWNVTANDGAGVLGGTEGAFVVTTASPTILYSATTDRAGFFVQNQGDNDVYFGFTNSLSITSNYFAKLTSGESATFAFTNTIYTIASTANSTISHGGD